MDSSQNVSDSSDVLLQVVTEIESSVSKVNSMLEDISVGASSQREGVSQILIAVQQMDAVTQGSAAASEQNAAAAEELSAQGTCLSDLARELHRLIEGGEAEQTTSSPATYRSSSPKPTIFSKKAESMGVASDSFASSGELNHGTNRVNQNEHIIPLDDNDFSAFN